MFEYTQKNHFKFGYKDNGWFINRTHQDEVFTCEYGRATDILSFREANIEAARYIANIATDDISIMLSGGADSEIAAWSFIDAGIPFEAAVMRFEGGYNSHDIEYAKSFCVNHGIKIRYYDLDVKKYVLSEEYENEIKRYQTTCERGVTLWLAKQIPNFAILGQGEPVIIKSLGRYWFQEKERICSWNKFWIFNEKPGIPGFHQFTPNQLLSVLLDDMTVDMVNETSHFWINDRFKHDFYKKHYPDFIVRPKYSGWEKLQDLNKKVQRVITATFPYFVDEWKIPYEDAVDNLMPRGD
jgi:hypothetical protein